MEKNKLKFEYVGFYPITDKNRGNCGKKIVGTLHIYCVDNKFDIRGIKVSIGGKGMFFCMPQIRTVDYESGEPCNYPIFAWTNEEDKKEMFDFLHKEVKPKVFKELKEAKIPTTPKGWLPFKKRDQAGMVSRVDQRSSSHGHPNKNSENRSFRMKPSNIRT